MREPLTKNVPLAGFSWSSGSHSTALKVPHGGMGVGGDELPAGLHWTVIFKQRATETVFNPHSGHRKGFRGGGIAAGPQIISI